FNHVNHLIEEESDRKLKFTAEIAEKESSIEKEKTDLITKEKTLSTRQKAINDHVTNIRHHESEKQINNERLRFLNDRASSLRDQIDQDKKSAERAHFAIQSLQTEEQSAVTILTEISEKAEI